MSDQLLDTDLNRVDTSFPVLQAGIYDLKIDDAEVIENSAKDGYNLKLKLVTTAPAMNTKSEQVGEGHPIFNSSSLTVKGKATADMIVRNVASIVQACQPGVTGISKADVLDVMGLKDKCAVLKGKIVRCKVDVEKERKNKETGKTYPEGNTIAQFIKL